MTDLRKSLLFFSIFLTASTGAAAQDNLVELPFRQGMRMLMENNLQLKSSSLDTRIAEARVTGAQGAFDPTLFGSFIKGDSSRPLSTRSSVAAGGLTSVESETFSANAGISGRTGIGTEYRLEVRDDWTADTFSGFEYEYESFTGVTVRQPLLKGFESADTLTLALAINDRQVSEERFRQTLFNALTEYSGAWWDLLTARQAVDVRTESLRLAETLLDLNRRKLEAGAISRLELVQTESAAASRKEDLLVAEKAVQDAQRRLKELIAEDAYAMSDDELVPTGQGILKPVAQGLEESISTALSTRPDYIEQKKVLERERITLKYASNQTWPEVDVEASYGFNGLGDSFRDSFGSISSNPEWSVGLFFSYPLGNRGARGELGAARLEARQALLRLKQIERETVLRLKAALQEIETDQKRLEAADVAVRLAEETLEAEGKKLEAGRSTTFNVLRIQEDLLLARLKRLDAVSDYNMALVGFYREKGTLIEELGIRISDIKEAQ